MKLSDQQAIEVFKALSDPNRLQLFQLLIESDRTNSEMMDATGLRQNLLSHHLNIMTEAGLIQVHRSVGDARRHYYSPRLEMATACRDWWVCNSPTPGAELPALSRPRRVLFLCLRNGARSFMAEAIARHLAPDALIPSSAGIEDAEIPVVWIGQRVLEENGVPLYNFEPKTYDALDETEFDIVVTVCDIVHERELPQALVQKTMVHWSLEDPLDVADDEAGQLAVTRQLYDEIVLRLSFLVQRLATQEARS